MWASGGPSVAAAYVADDKSHGWRKGQPVVHRHSGIEYTIERFLHDGAEVVLRQTHSFGATTLNYPTAELGRWFEPVGVREAVVSGCECGAHKAGVNARGGGAHSHWCREFKPNR